MSGPPFLLVITSDPETLNRVAGELERRYSPDYEVARATSAQEAAATSERLALDGRLVALIIFEPKTVRRRWIGSNGIRSGAPRRTADTCANHVYVHLWFICEEGNVCQA